VRRRRSRRREGVKESGERKEEEGEERGTHAKCRTESVARQIAAVVPALALVTSCEPSKCNRVKVSLRRAYTLVPSDA